jgi:hypothetical protein
VNVLWVGQLRGSDFIHSRGNRYGSSVALAHTIPYMSESIYSPDSRNCVTDATA